MSRAVSARRSLYVRFSHLYGNVYVVCDDVHVCAMATMHNSRRLQDVVCVCTCTQMYLWL